MAGSISICCDTCDMRNTDHCKDCVVSYILGQEAEAQVFSMEEARAIKMLAKAGLTPELRFTNKSA